MAENSKYGKRPDMAWINTQKLFVDDAYQRDAHSRKSADVIGKIAAGFAWAKCQPLTVARIADQERYAVIDGQHRLIAARKIGITEMPCYIVEDCETQEQAQHFVAVNRTRVQMHSLALYHANLAAGDPDHADLDQLLKECGFSVPKSPAQNGDTAPDQVQCVGTLLRMMHQCTKKQIVFALTVIPEAYGQTRGMMRSSLIKGICGLYRELDGKIDRETMIDTLLDIEPQSLEENARLYKNVHGGTVLKAICITLSQAYHKAQRHRNRTVKMLKDGGNHG